MNFMTFHILGMSSSQLTNSYFSEGCFTTNQIWFLPGFYLIAQIIFRFTRLVNYYCNLPRYIVYHINIYIYITNDCLPYLG